MGINLSSLLDPGAIAHQVVDSFLPKDMQWVGGVVGAAVDYECGNEVGAVKQGVSALSDLKDVPQSAPANKPAASASTDAANKTAPSSTPAGPKLTWAHEPSPPEPRVTTTTTTTTTTVTSGPGTAPKTVTKPSTPTTSSGWRSAQHLPSSSAAPKAPTASGGWRPSATALVRVEPRSPGMVGHPPAPTAASASRTGPTAQTVTTTTTTTTTGATPSATTTGATPSAPTLRSASVGSELVKLATESAARLQSSTPSSSKPASTAAVATPSAAPDSAPSAKPSAAASSAAATATKPSSTDPSTLSKDNFMNLSDDDLMKAVRDGKIPTDVTDSQAGMMALQARMDHISEMNKMMTSMMEAMHQMKMGVIDNLRA